MKKRVMMVALCLCLGAGMVGIAGCGRGEDAQTEEAADEIGGLGAEAEEDMDNGTLTDEKADEIEQEIDADIAKED